MSTTWGVTSGTTSWLKASISALATTDSNVTTTTGMSSITSINDLYSSDVTYSQTSLDSLADTALSQGIDLYTDGDYKSAIKYFKESVGLSYGSDNSASAYDYMAKAYLKLDKTDEAIKTYKQAISVYPTRDDFHLALGDIYLDEDNNDAALTEYKAAVRRDPTSAENRYSLGQSYLTAGQFSDASEQFSKVVQISPTSASGYYGLGQVARAAGDYQGAILQLNKAISTDRSFVNSYLELGKTYADMDNLQQANEQVSYLTGQGSTDATTAATTLSTYISQVSQPQIASVESQDGFDTTLGTGTEVSELSSELSDKNTSQLFSMTFTFSKDMDASSVINSKNWTISRATILNNGGAYNYGRALSSTEAYIASKPAYVTYDANTYTATIYFRISQNANANATIDPEHIVFKFYGTDIYGKAIDKSADQYSGFSGVA
jgi:tetratricopeptide (TPR) repeat protein